MGILLSKYIANIFYKTIKVILVVGLFIAIFNVNKVFAESKKEKSSEQLKAELVYNFIDHTVWLGQELAVKNLCVMEDNPIIPYLNILARNNRNIVVIRKYENDYLKDCQILFIDDSYQGYIKRLLYRVRTNPILTFSNIKDFAQSGGIVQFTLSNNRVKFIINTKEMESSQLKISDGIISISDIID